MPRDITQAEIPLSDRTVLVVGAASGIGRATAERFLRAGSRVILAARHPERCGDLQTLAPAGQSSLLRLDLTDPGTFDDARAALAGADQPVVVITAGILRAGALEELDDGELHAVLETNLIGPLVLIRRLLPELRRSGGTVIVTTSLSGLAGLPGDVAYAASKWGLEGAMEALRHEVDRFGVRVALVEFGLVNTALFDHDLAHPVAPDSPYGPLSVWQRESLRRRIGSGMDPGEVADAILRIACVDEGQLRYPVGAVAERVVATLLGQDAATRDAFLRKVAGTDWWSDGQDPPEA